MNLPDRTMEVYWPPSKNERDFWSCATYSQRVWAMKCQYVFLVLFGLLFLYGLGESSLMLYGGVIGLLPQAGIIAFYEALSREYRNEDRLIDEEVQEAEQAEVGAKKDAARKTLLLNDSTHTSRTLKKWVTVEYHEHGHAVPLKDTSVSSSFHTEVDYERFGIKVYSLPPAVIAALKRKGPSILGGGSKVPMVNGDSLTPEQKRAVDRYLRTCLRIEDFVAEGVSDTAKADAYAKIDELAAATAVELQMLSDLKRYQADMDLRDWIAGIEWYE